MDEEPADVEDHESLWLAGRLTCRCGELWPCRVVRERLPDLLDAGYFDL